MKALWLFAHLEIRILKNSLSMEQKKGLNAQHVFKIERILDRLDAAKEVTDMNFPGSNFHKLKGDLKDFYSVHVNGNWVIIFRFLQGDAYDVDLLDYP